jgi:predicted nuclease of predicted toxin-antitoxin system
VRFLVDNSLSPRMAQGLGFAGHDAVHVRDLGLAGAGDDRVLDRAIQEGRVLLAEDADFGTILAARDAPSPSVVTFRCRLKSPERLLPLFLKQLPRFLEDLDAGAVVVIEDSRIRVRRLPF